LGTVGTKSTDITLTTIAIAVPDQVSTNLEDEAVILHLKDGIYFGLNPVASRIWDLLEVSRTVGEIRDILLKEYEVEPAQCEGDLLKLLEELHDRGLIEIKSDKAP
jgi:hypothetical protein